MPKSPDVDAEPRSFHPLISAARVQDTPVFDAAGEPLGRLEDVMLHKLSGEVAYAVLAAGGFLGAGERLHPVPWSLLSYDAEKGGYVCPLERGVLDQAPALSREELGEDDESWRERVHAHFQASPYWL